MDEASGLGTHQKSLKNFHEAVKKLLENPLRTLKDRWQFDP